MAVDSCTIPSNPDVSGIGVRAAIYAQNLTCFLPVIVHLWDGKISRDELKGVKDQSIGMLAVAFAILFTTIILAKGAGGDQTITSYHAAVVLDLSWMNNTSTWIWFILYAHHRSKRDDHPTGANWSEWCNTLLEPVRELLGRNDGPGTSTEVTRTVQRRRRRGIAQRIWHIAQRTAQCIWRIAQRIWRIAQRIWGFVSEQPVLTLGSIHLSLMAAVGIWLWSDPSKFGQPLDPSCDPTLTVIGVPARFSSKPLRITSLAMYSLVLIPGLNLIPPFTFFLMLHISYNWSREQHKLFWTRWDSILKVLTPKKSSPSPDAEQGGSSQRSSTAVSSGVAQHEPSGSSPNTALPIGITAYNPDNQPRAAPETEQDGSSQHSAVVSSGVTQPEQPGTPHTAFLIIGLVLLVAINILFIVDIELTLRRNKGDQTGNEATWGFGQVLALLLLIIPLRDAWGALQDIREKLKGVQQQFEELLLRECQVTPGYEEFKHLIQKGANPNLWADSRFSNSLQVGAYYGKVDLVQFLLEEGTKDRPATHFETALQSASAGGHVPMVQFLLKEGFEDKPGGQFQTALQAAAAGGNVLMVQVLLQSNNYAERLDEVGGKYGTALCAACANGKVEVVEALLQAGARRNGDGKHFGAPLHVAILMENMEMVELLIGNTPNDADCIWESVGRAVDVAGLLQNRDMFELLWKKGLKSVRCNPSPRRRRSG
ncbi:ankyrin repeat-containing domain protein [Mycena olivaceomarginata]|nr:ankyrin repeat-containing domain protein [Mycena olivaceomarginata]